MLHEHTFDLQRILRDQGELEQLATKLLQDAWSSAIAGAPWQWQWEGVQQPFVLKRFGSRSSGYALPSSDLDIVCELQPNRLGAQRHAVGTMEPLLYAVQRSLQGDPRCSAVVDGVDYKATVSFKFEAQLIVDCTACVGHANFGHAPSQISNAVRVALDRLHSRVREFSLLLVDKVKQAGACWDRRGPVGVRLKAVHWILLAIAWWRAHELQCQEASLHCCLQQFFNFYALFSFEDYCITALRGRPFNKRDQALASEVMWLADPQSYQRNLLGRVTTSELSRIRELLSRICTSLEIPALLFVAPLRERWKLHTGGCSNWAHTACESAFKLWGPDAPPIRQKCKSPQEIISPMALSPSIAIAGVVDSQSTQLDSPKSVQASTISTADTQTRAYPEEAPHCTTQVQTLACTFSSWDRSSWPPPKCFLGCLDCCWSTFSIPNHAASEHRSMMVFQEYHAEAAGYLSVGRGEYVQVFSGYEAPGEDGCAWLRYVFAQRESAGDRGWLPVSMAWERFVDETGRGWAQCLNGECAWEDQI